MEIKSFEDITKIDAELAGLFLRPDEAVNWINAVEGEIKDWIGKYNKQYWEIVRHVSLQRGILGKLMTNKREIRLTREDFANVLLKFCRQAISEDETVATLKSSMAHYKFVDVLKKLDEAPLAHVVRPLIKNVEDMFDKKPIVIHAEPKSSSMVDIVEKYLRSIADNNENKYPCSIVCIRPQYDGFSPALSVETYVSSKLQKEKRPSYIIAYEFVEGVLSINKLYELWGQYGDKRWVKLFVVSSAGLLPEVRALALEKDIGYVRLNSNKEMISDNYELPRSIEDYTKWRHDRDVLTGQIPLTTPMLIMDGPTITASLADVLSDNNVAVKKQHLLNVPYLSNEEIEIRANALTSDDVERQYGHLIDLGIMNVDLMIDPFAYVKSWGLTWELSEFEEENQLGLLDLQIDVIFLKPCDDDYPRFRFTVAHELGHYLLHAPLFKERGVVSVGESLNTISLSETDSRRLEYQANKFASYLLMPQKLVVALYALYFSLYVTRVHGDGVHALYYNPEQPETWDSYNNVVRPMCKLLGVSKTAMNIRLKELGLLEIGH
jgi:hypothetical protein